MDFAFTEFPLAVFTTLAPMGAGAFIALAIAFFTTSFDDDQLRRIDHWTAVPIVVMVVGFAVSFLHLASPMNAINVFRHIGYSPLSNEIMVGSIFLVVAVVYWVLAMTGKLSHHARMVFSCVLAACSLIFSLFIGLAYMMYTIASWNTPLVALAMLGFCLAGGVVLGTLVLACAGGDAFDRVRATSFKTIAMITLFVGVVLAIFMVCLHVSYVQSLYNAAITGVVPLPGAMGYLVVFVVCLIAALIAERFALVPPKSKSVDVESAVPGAPVDGVEVSVDSAGDVAVDEVTVTPAPLSAKATIGIMCAGTVVIAIGIFVARLVFYAMQVSVGL